MDECIYVLSNPSFPGKIKVGRTINIEERVSQLFTTGVPTPFVVEFAAAVNNGWRAERLAHEALSRQRVAGNREFFEVPDVDAVTIIVSEIGEHIVRVDREAAAENARRGKSELA